jgi:hypothetical protein
MSRNATEQSNALTTYFGLLYYRPYRNLTGRNAGIALRAMGSKAKLPKKGREVLVIETPYIFVHLVNGTDSYYFKETRRATRSVRVLRAN